MPNPYSKKGSFTENEFNFNFSTTNLTNATTLLKTFQGPPQPYKTIKISKNCDHVFLNHRNDSIKILVDFDRSGYSSIVPILMKKRKIVDFEPFETDKLVTLTLDNIINVFRFQTFGHYEKIAQFANFPKSWKLSDLQFCPKQKFLTLVKFQEDSKKKKIFQKILILAITKKKDGNDLKKKCGGYKIGFRKVYEIPFNFNATEFVWTGIPFYWKGKPVLGIFEREARKNKQIGRTGREDYVRSRLYFYTFGLDKFTIVKDLLFPRV